MENCPVPKSMIWLHATACRPVPYRPIGNKCQNLKNPGLRYMGEWGTGSALE
jgi:hypothetical protein